ncbi:MAG: hypothetical protein QM669_11080 [Siphonobacter sp.]
MKKVFLTLGAAALVTMSSWAQEGEKRPITSAEYDAAKKIVVKNLEKDSYVKAGSFILDRSGDPVSFKFSDGTERKVYLYKLYDTEKMAELGMYVIYTTPKDGKMKAFPVPSPDAPGEVWGKYIDDLKYGEEAMKGLASCVAFAFTRHGIGGAGAEVKEGEKIEYCFPAESLIMLANGTTTTINSVQAGDKLVSFNAQTQQQEVAIVKQVDRHDQKEFALTRITLVNPDSKVTASNAAQFEGFTLEATANHPVLTADGVKKMSDVRVGDVMYHFDGQTLQAFDVFVTHQSARSVEKVYNLVTDKATYIVNGTVVMTK